MIIFSIYILETVSRCVAHVKQEADEAIPMTKENGRITGLSVLREVRAQLQGGKACVCLASCICIAHLADFISISRTIESLISIEY